MARLKPSTAEAVWEMAQNLSRLADDIEPARPFLAEIYRALAEELSASLVVPEAPFRLKIPEGASTETTDSQVILYPPNFDAQKYYRRLTKAAS